MSLQQEEETPGIYTKALWGHKEKACICEQRTEALGETNHASIMISDFQPSECGKINVYYLGHSFGGFFFLF